jgi:acyl-homoserine-lactone acylase
MLMAGLLRISGADAGPVRDVVTIAWTSHGIPHVTGSNFRALGYGYGFATAQLDPCGMADAFATFSGRRSSEFGEDQGDLVRILGRRPIANPVSDSVRAFLLGDEDLAKAKRSLSAQARDLISGYAQGYDRFVKNIAASKLPPACAAHRPVPITSDDVIRRIQGVAMLMSSGLFLQEIYDAAPPSQAQTPRSKQASSLGDLPISAGSNAYAFGRSMTGGAGLLFGNPHFFWDGPDRFVEAHLTVPGKYDVMGASLLGMPLINIGFNRSLAWSHTVSTDDRGAIYVLQLDPKDPTRYMVDGQSIPMSRKHVIIRARRGDGTFENYGHDFWLTRYGPVIADAALPWSKTRAFALRDANQENFRLVDQWLAIGRSKNVAELKENLGRIEGLPWLNTLAADSGGNALFADISVTPAIDAAMFARCHIELPFPLKNYVTALDGSRSDCAWPNNPETPQANILPPDQKPALIRSDYVENSNNSYWLSNPADPLEGFSPVIGQERTPLNFRARQGHLQIRNIPSISLDSVERMFDSERSLQADNVVPALVQACQATPMVTLDDGTKVSLTRACEILGAWDRRYDLDSVGSYLFTAFVRQAKTPGTEDLAENPRLWRTPFDFTKPLETPAGLDTTNPEVLAALGRAVRKLLGAGIPLDAKLREVQFVVRNGQTIPLPGGATFSALSATLQPTIGFTDPINPSNSYIQVVTFGRHGPIADAILASSQSRDPGSPFFSDQTRLYSQKKWLRLPFTKKAARADQVGPTISLLVPPR